jgi:transketolase
MSAAPEVGCVPGTTAARRDVINVLRVLAMDALQKADSDHPGMPMGMAEIAEVLWRRHLRHNPLNPRWVDRDRFVLSNGHGSMLLYALLHLSGYDLSMAHLKQFQPLHSQTPGHPQYGITPGQTSTGPLGQGMSNAVGFALAEKRLAEEFNRPGFEIVSHYTYVFLGDARLLEGISHEACSLAGTLGLGKLIAIYDDDGGHVKSGFTADIPRRFEVYGWHVVRDVDGHDSEAIERAIYTAKAERLRPSLICCKMTLGKGAPLGEKEIAATREALQWPHAPFEIPQEIYEAWDACEAGALAEGAWRLRLGQYLEAYPAEAKQLQRRWRGGFDADAIDLGVHARLDRP